MNKKPIEAKDVIDMQRFIERVLEQNGYALRGEHWVPADH